MPTDETNTSTSIDLACLPIGCSVSAKYRGAFCTAQVKSVEKQVKLKVTLLDNSETITIAEEQIVHPVPLRIGNIVTIRLPSSSNRLHVNDLSSHLSRSGLAAIISASNNDEKQGTIKHIIDNSTYTVVFNDGDEKSLRRSSLCLKGIRLYSTKIGQQKMLEELPTTSSLPSTTDINDITSIVGVRREGNKTQHVFPALILKRKALADYMWVKSFLDGREYIVHKRDDVQSYKNNSEIQSLCRSTSKQATKACDKFIKYNQIPIVWQKKKTNELNNVDNTSDNDSNTSESDIDDNDKKTIEEKDSFVAQLFAFMDDRGTPINNIPKVHNYDLDLHRLFNIVRIFGGYNKVTKNDQWDKIYIKMGLPDDSSSTENGQSIEHAYKKYLFAYEDLSKKLGTMNASSSYFGSRTNMSSDSRRSLIRVRQEPEEKNSKKKTKFKSIPSPIKQQSRKRSSLDSKQNLSSTKNPRRKTIFIHKTKSSSTSESESSDDETSISSSSNYDKNKLKKQQKKMNSTINKPKSKKKIISSIIDSQKRSISAPVIKIKSPIDTENTMKPVIKIAKLSYEILKDSTPSIAQFSKKPTSNKVSKTQDNTSTNQSNSDQNESKLQTPPLALSDSIKPTIIQDLTPLPVTPVSPSPPPSIIIEPTTPPLLFINTHSVSYPYDKTTDGKETEFPSIFQSIISSSSSQSHQQTNETSNSNKRAHSTENSEFLYKIDEPLFPSKRSRHSNSSQDSSETTSNEQFLANSTSINNRNTRLKYDDIVVNDVLLVKWDLNRKKQYYARCTEKNDSKKELHVHYKGWNSKHDEWIKLDRVIKRKDETDLNDEEIIIDIGSSFPLIDENEQDKSRKFEEKKFNSNDQDNGRWKNFERTSSSEDDTVSCSLTNHINNLNHSDFQSMFILPSISTEEATSLQHPISTNNTENILRRNIYHEFESIDDHDNGSISDDNPIQQRLPTEVGLISSAHSEHISSTSNILIHPSHMKVETILDDSSIIPQSIPTLIEAIIPSDNRRASTRQQKRRTFRDPNNTKDSFMPAKKKSKLDIDINSNSNVDSINNSDQSSVSMEQQLVETKRYRTVGKRGGKKSVNQPDNENDDFPSNSPLNVTIRQQLEDMFKHKSSRYDFLDLNNNLTGDHRLAHLKDRMRQCQKVFFNLKSALTKIEKQKKIFIRRQKSAIVETTTNELSFPSTCT